jgi:hypothetical protein
MRKFGFVLAAAIAPLMSGCAEFSTVMAGVSDQMAFDQGYYYDDEHHSQTMTGDCAGFWEYGRANNQSYQRVRNISPVPVSFTLVWSSGYETTTYLDPGQTSDFFYMTPSVIPQRVDSECDMDGGS